MDKTINSLDCFAIFVIVFWTGLWIHHLLGILLSYLLLNRPLSMSDKKDLPGITVLKPLKGIDSNLSTNLETFFNMNYPTYELLFCVENESDPAADVVMKLISKYPKVTARLVTGAPKLGINPKVNNLNSGYSAAQYDFVLISDSSNYLQPDAPKDMISRMKDNVAIVHQIPFVRHRPGFAAALEKVSSGTLVRHNLFLNTIRYACLSGTSYLLRRSALDSCGGLKDLSNYLAEDFYLGNTLTSKGWKMVISSYPALQNSGSTDTRGQILRFFRWAQLRTKIAPMSIILEPLCECFVIGPLACWALDYFILADGSKYRKVKESDVV